MSKSVFLKISPEVLRWARESISKSIDEVEKDTGIDKRRIRDLEQGYKNPSLPELKEMSKSYKRTIATLLLDKAPTEKGLPKDMRTVNSAELEDFHPSTILAVRTARSLSKSFIQLRNELGIIPIKFQYSATLSDSPKLKADFFREVLNLKALRSIENNNQFLDGCIESVNSIGVAVFQLRLVQDGIRGFSLVDEEIPVIVIKRNNELPTSKTFTLFHEFAHILLNEGGICDMRHSSTYGIEKWCNAFAAEILMPEEEFMSNEIIKSKRNSKDLNWTKSELINLSNSFHVGPLSILRRLLENNLATEDFYREKHDLWNKPSFGRSKKAEGRNISKEMVKEKGRSYVSMAFKAYDQNRIDLKDLSDYLGLKLKYLPKARELTTM